MPKFMLSIHEQQYEQMSQEAERLGITVQELMRAVIVPFYYRYSPPISDAIEKRALEEAFKITPDRMDFRKDIKGNMRP